MSSLLDFLAAGLTGSPWWAVLLYFIVVMQLTIFSVTLYLHRSQAHRAVEFHPLLAHFFRFWAWLTTAMVTKEWVAIHRLHHARCETDQDPHSPLVHGIGKVVFHGVTLYQQSCKDREMIDQYGLNCPNDWIERKLYTPLPSLGPTLLLFIDVALFGAIGLALWAVQMLTIPVLAAGVVNGLGHWWGYRNFETFDCSTNLTPWGLIIGGEELHNNHHAFPSSARFSMRRAEFDIGWAAIQLFRRFGLAKVLREAPRLTVRDQVELPDQETLRAVVSYRFQIFKRYFKEVTLPVWRQEIVRASSSAAGMGRRMRRALANDGLWLDDSSRERLSQMVAEHPMTATVVEYRRRLTDLINRSGKSSQVMLESLQQWCFEAEKSGIKSLEDFARSLRGYALVPTPN